MENNKNLALALAATATALSDAIEKSEQYNKWWSEKISENAVLSDEIAKLRHENEQLRGALDMLSSELHPATVQEESGDE